MQRRRVRVVADNQVVHERVDFVSGRAHRQQAFGTVQHELGEPATIGDQLYLTAVLDLRLRIMVRFVDEPGPGVGRHRNVFRNRVRFADLPGVHRFVHAEIRLELRPQPSLGQ